LDHSVQVDQCLGCQLNWNSQLSVNMLRHFAILLYKLLNFKVEENLVEKN